MMGSPGLLCIRLYGPMILKPERRRIHPGGSNFARLPGPVSLWTSDWYRMPIARISDDDIASWPFSVGLLLKIVHFLGSLHWPRGADDLGVGGVSYLELLILYEKWAGERLVLEGARFLLHEHGFFLGKALGNVLWLLHCPVSPGSCLISGQWLAAVVHDSHCGYTHCECTRQQQQQQQHSVAILAQVVATRGPA